MIYANSGGRSQVNISCCEFFSTMLDDFFESTAFTYSMTTDGALIVAILIKKMYIENKRTVQQDIFFRKYLPKSRQIWILRLLYRTYARHCVFLYNMLFCTINAY